jgi:hypothetical protein
MMSDDFISEFDYVISKGWWFSVIPKYEFKTNTLRWFCTIYKLKANGKWQSYSIKNFTNMNNGLVWVEKFLEKKLWK